MAPTQAQVADEIHLYRKKIQEVYAKLKKKPRELNMRRHQLTFSEVVDIRLRNDHKEVESSISSSNDKEEGCYLINVARPSLERI